MKKMILGIAGACALIGLATTASAQVYGDTAKVLSATPIYDRAAPRRECRVEPTTTRETDRRYPNGYRTAGNEVLADSVPVERDVERCGSGQAGPERIVGYEVRYEYNGRQFSARMPFDPGPQMPVNVEVRPPIARDYNGAPRSPNYRGPY